MEKTMANHECAKLCIGHNHALLEAAKTREDVLSAIREVDLCLKQFGMAYDLEIAKAQIGAARKKLKELAACEVPRFTLPVKRNGEKGIPCVDLAPFYKRAATVYIATVGSKASELYYWDFFKNAAVSSHWELRKLPSHTSNRVLKVIGKVGRSKFSDTAFSEYYLLHCFNDAAWKLEISGPYPDYRTALAAKNTSFNVASRKTA